MRCTLSLIVRWSPARAFDCYVVENRGISQKSVSKYDFSKSHLVIYAISDPFHTELDENHWPRSSSNAPSHLLLSACLEAGSVQQFHHAEPSQGFFLLTSLAAKGRRISGAAASYPLPFALLQQSCSARALCSLLRAALRTISTIARMVCSSKRRSKRHLPRGGARKVLPSPRPRSSRLRNDGCRKVFPCA